MRTHYVGDTYLDESRLAKDLEQADSIPWSEAYSDYVFGGAWKSCMLWARGGDAGDGVVTHYDHDRPAAFSDFADQLPYLRELIAEVADLDRLNFVRLAKVQNSVIIPHRDLLELSELADETRNAHRMHIPLATNEDCFFNEGDTVYRMRKGEVWFLDASEIHSVAVLSSQERVHLMFDFVDVPSTKPLITVGGASPDAGIPADRTVKRPPLTDAAHAELMRLADVLTLETVNEIFSIVIKKHFRYDGGENFVWNSMIDIARAAADPAVLAHVEELRRHYTLERSA
ncbi:aspartyl/asparaginyl beta-hydroxylase domain-containing protein [Streptomyces sp. H10-C2]|uniref:aspartyl/asparaginyl beta-hydroxylase domain-containing protein n=1 Tax=unclassified Streptomyces TaxID=2593676 RepID=UPI0024B88F11|nr:MULTISPECIES: aspartyl/asparaginyl beta-hydroxylase domain-containing protein [unclassified Streptomyces]MDJ0344811.1 aspartyl/asparaginyl beta-hydroxylase domain-containing protein [Streptomyces sp. PH10-H1]MDJ0369696.1 aspartyl/asparaginyl beta-hydroxylase domain-containing protein [Streptomyces sp. H10-C2]